MLDITAGNIYSFKINNGQEVVGKVTAISDSHYVLTMPLAVGVTNQGLQFIPFMLSSDQVPTVDIPKTSVLALCIPREDVIDSYEKSFNAVTSNLVMPPEKHIIT